MVINLVWSWADFFFHLKQIIIYLWSLCDIYHLWGQWVSPTIKNFINGVVLHPSISMFRLRPMSHFMGLAAPGYVKHRLSMHLCFVGQCQLGHTYWHQSSYTWGQHSLSGQPVAWWFHCNTSRPTKIYCEHRIELLPPPLQQTAQGYLPDFLGTLWPLSETENLVFFMLTWSLLLSMPAFHALILEMHSSWMSTMSTRSWA